MTEMNKRAVLLTMMMTAVAAAAAMQQRTAAAAHTTRPGGGDNNNNNNNNNSKRGLRNGHRPLLRHEHHPHDNHHRRRRRLPQAMGTPTATATTDGDAEGEGGAFNPNLVTYDPLSPEYQFDHSSSSVNTTTGSDIPPPEGWSPCPSDNLNFSGHRASYDCTSYIECSGGQPRGEYLSCMGLKFDNEQGVCDWAENVVCGSGDDAEAGGGEEEEEGVGEEGEVENQQEEGGDDSDEEIIGSITDYDIDMTNSAGSNGAESNNEVTGWQGGSDWGGSWIDGVWYDFFVASCCTPCIAMHR